MTGEADRRNYATVGSKRKLTVSEKDAVVKDKKPDEEHGEHTSMLHIPEFVDLRMKDHKETIKLFIAECCGTFFLVELGCAAVAVSLYLNKMSGSWQVGVVWLLGAALGIYISAAVSGAHLNPAVSISFALVRNEDFPWMRVPIYIAAQFTGAFWAAVINYCIYTKAIAEFELQNNITRGAPGSALSASAFGDYWSLSPFMANAFQAVFIEAFGTAMLTFVIFSCTSPKNNAVPSTLAAALIAVTIGLMNTLLGPMTGPSINPARDLGPKLFCAMAGWRVEAFTDWWVYIIGPCIGGPIGAAVADFIVYPVKGPLTFKK